MKAFPNGVITNSDGLVVGGQNGMDLRDYFAAQAMQELIPLLANQPDINNGDQRRKEVSVLAYKQADAMMEARIKE
jgi:hypothetical protein